MSVALHVTVELTEINCGQCGGVYALNERYRKQCETKGRSWHCPYCETGWGYQEGTEAKLRKELDAEKARHLTTLARANEEQAARLQVEKALKRDRTRTQAGVCTCCNRSFVNLRRHMATKHSVA